MGSYNVLKIKESPGHMKLQNGKVKFTLIFIFTEFFKYYFTFLKIIINTLFYKIYRWIKT